LKKIKEFSLHKKELISPSGKWRFSPKILKKGLYKAWYEVIFFIKTLYQLVCFKVNTRTTLAVTKGHMFGSSFKIIEKKIKGKKKKKKNTKI
jgi:hypothetical protein